MNKIIDGRKISKEIRIELANQIKDIEVSHSLRPKLAVALVGDNSSALAYVNGIKKMSKLACIDVELTEHPATISELKFLEEIERINNDNSVNGLLVLMPLPAHISKEKVFELLLPIKDVDGLTSQNIGDFYQGKNSHNASTPKGVDLMIEHLNLDIKGFDACVIGASNVVGKPMAELLLQREATVSICHKETKSLKKYTKDADLIVACAGVAHLVKEEMVKEGAIIIDVGVNFIDGKMVGDCDFDNMKDKVSLITPVPGGVGPMTIATLFTQTFNSFKEMNNF